MCNMIFNKKNNHYISMNMTNKGSKYDFTLSGKFLGTTHGNLPGSLQFLLLIQVS